jgi:hypothetical protein
VLVQVWLGHVIAVVVQMLSIVLTRLFWILMTIWT